MEVSDLPGEKGAMYTASEMVKSNGILTRSQTWNLMFLYVTVSTLKPIAATATECVSTAGADVREHALQCQCNLRQVNIAH